MYLTKRYSRLENEKIFVMIGGWGVPKWIFKFVKNNFPKDWGYLEYHYDKHKICSKPSEIKSKFLNIIEVMKSDLINLNKIRERKFYIYTVSLGNIFGLILADYIKVEKMAMVVPICNLARIFWKRNKKDTIGVKAYFNKIEPDLAKLKENWKELSLKNWFTNNSTKTKFLLRLSKDDIYLSSDDKINILGVLKRKKVNFIYEQKFLSHKLTGMFDAIFPGRIIKFFME